MTRRRSRVPVEWITKRLGLSRSRYYDWRQRRAQGRLRDRQPVHPQLDRALPEEEEAVKSFALEHPRDGYRRLAWMMVDEDVAYLSPSSVYRILDRADLLCRWKPPGKAGRKPQPPTAPHQQWHTDLMYLWVKGRWYFFVSVLDSFSRYLVHWELLASMRAADVRDVIHAALEKHPGLQPRIVHDNGSQFTSRDFKKLVKRFALEQIQIRLYHPQSNGRIERFHRSLRRGLAGHDPAHQLEARDLIGDWVEHYNQERLHAALHYLTPEDYLQGRQEKRLAERRQKLHRARRHRRRENAKRKASCQRSDGGLAPTPPGFTASDEAGGTEPGGNGGKAENGSPSPAIGRSGRSPALPYPPDGGGSVEEVDGGTKAAAC